MPRSAPRADERPAPVARPGRRAVLVMVGVLASGTAACSAPASRERTPAPSRPSSPPTSRPPGAQEADDEARRALLSVVDGLRSRAAALVGAGGASGLVVAVGTALDGQASALSTRLDAQRPSAASSAPPDGSPATLAEALAAGAAAAVVLLGARLSGPMARLVAAVAAGHAVGADVVARASALPQPQGLPAAGGPGGTVPAAPPGLARPHGAAGVRALARARDVEAQARYAYGVAAVHLEGDVLAAALALRTAHDEAVTVLDAALSVAPGGAAPGPGPRDAWDLPFAVGDDVTAATLAARVEDGCADAWADVVAASTGAERATAATTLTGCALQGARWRYQVGRGADLTTLPGLSGRT